MTKATKTEKQAAAEALAELRKLGKPINESGNLAAWQAYCKALDILKSVAE